MIFSAQKPLEHPARRIQLLPPGCPEEQGLTAWRSCPFHPHPAGSGAAPVPMRRNHPPGCDQPGRLQPNGERPGLPFRPARRGDAGFHRRARRGRPGCHARRRRRLGGDPAKINPLVPVDLVIDHSCRWISSPAGCPAAQRRPGVPAQPRALRVPALGAESLR